MKLLLASRSAARRAMLAAAGVPFAAVDTSIDEDVEKARLRQAGAGAAALAEALAGLKARGVHAGETDLVLGCDQTLELADGAMLDKPHSRDAARTQLARLSGATHRLHAAAAIAAHGALVWRHVESVRLRMRPLSESYIEAYLDWEFEAIRHGVGGYRVEGPGVQLFDSIEGSHFAILGLPLLPLLAYLRERGLLAS